MASSALEEKINKIRQQNEEIRRRHEEVEADKQHAAKLNALVQMVPSTDWPERKEPPEFVNPIPKNISKPKASGREHRGQQQQYHAGGGDGKKVHVFAVGDGPPPDPSYNFLADSERDDRIKENSRDSEKFKGRDSRGGPKKRGTNRSASFKESRGSGVRPKDFSKPEYEAWRAERNRIDEARISRQRTAEGNWRREWDNNKINIEENEEGSTKTTRVTTDYKEFDKWPVDPGNDSETVRGRGGRYHSNRAAPRGSHTNRGYYRSKSFEYQGPLSPVPPLSPSAIDERMVLATDKSLKVIVNHGPTSPKGPLMSVRVSPASIAGTGRVGPRQKPRVLYSSQTDGDVTSNDLDKFSGYKSSDDKASRSFHHRDGTEQRYSPKSPHLQRKAENNVKSPFSRKKDFKHVGPRDGPTSVQSQKHAENESRSQQPQKHEVKDNLKSPHFEKKVEFANCDTQFKQRNGISESDGKSFQSQKKIFEKNKNDFHKVSASPKNSANRNEKKKNERNDDDTPKSQRTTKRPDKSKVAPNRNVSESQTAHRDTNGVQMDTNGSIKISENISNDKKYDKNMGSIVNVCEPDNCKDMNNIKNAKNGSQEFRNVLNDSENVSGNPLPEVCDKSVVHSSELLSTTAFIDAEANLSSENSSLPKSTETVTSHIIHKGDLPDLDNIAAENNAYNASEKDIAPSNVISQISHKEDLPDLDNIAVESNAYNASEKDIAPSNDEIKKKVTDENDIEIAVVDTDRNNGENISIPKVSNDEIADASAVEASRNVRETMTVITTLPEVSKTDICLNPKEVFDENGRLRKTTEDILGTTHSPILEQKEITTTEMPITTTEIASNSENELAEMSLQETH